MDSGVSLTSGSPEPDRDEPDRDELYDVLSNQRRRQALHYLKQEADRRVDLSELSTRVAAWERGVAPEAVAYDDRKSVHTALAQFHLPKMDDAGVVDFDAARNTVALTDAGSELTVYSEVVEADELPWSVYFGLVSAVAVGLLAAVGTGVPVLSALSPGDVAVMTTGAFAVSSLAFLYDARYRMRLGRDGPPPTGERPGDRGTD